MRSLVTDLAHFARSDGAQIHEALRRKLPYLRFSFDKFAGDQRDGVLRRLFEADATLAKTLQSIRSKLPDTPTMQALSVLIDRLGQLASHNLLQGEDLKTIQAASAEDLGDAEPMLDPGRINLSDAPNQTLRKGLQEALRNEASLTPDERGALDELIDVTSNIEQLLALYFVRFLSGSPADQRTYLYLVWMLWAFLRSRSARATGQAASLYPRLASLADAVITFNYTPFIRQVKPPVEQVTFFHGRLDQYLALDTRVSTDIPSHLLETEDQSRVASFLQARRLDVEQSLRLDVPALVPPTLFKPVMSREQLLLWADADRALQTATMVVVVGYSFGIADEHFNDLLRKCNPLSRIVVVNPDPGVPVDAACRLLQLDRDRLHPIQGALPMQGSGRLVCVQARAEDIDRALIQLVDAVATG